MPKKAYFDSEGFQVSSKLAFETVVNCKFWICQKVVKNRKLVKNIILKINKKTEKLVKLFCILQKDIDYLKRY